MIRFFLWLLLICAVAAEEIPAAQVARVSHAEGFRCRTASYGASQALVWRKGETNPAFMLIVQHGRGPERYFTLGSGKGPLVGEGKNIRFTLDEQRHVLRVESRGPSKTWGLQAEEKILETLDS